MGYRWWWTRIIETALFSVFSRRFHRHPGLCFPHHGCPAPFVLWGRSMHQDGREGVTGPFFLGGRGALRRLLCTTGLSKTRILVDFFKELASKIACQQCAWPSFAAWAGLCLKSTIEKNTNPPTQECMCKRTKLIVAYCLPKPHETSPWRAVAHHGHDHHHIRLVPVRRSLLVVALHQKDLKHPAPHPGRRWLLCRLAPPLRHELRKRAQFRVPRARCTEERDHREFKATKAAFETAENTHFTN